MENEIQGIAALTGMVALLACIFRAYLRINAGYFADPHAAPTRSTQADREAAFADYWRTAHERGQLPTLLGLSDNGQGSTPLTAGAATQPYSPFECYRDAEGYINPDDFAPCDQAAFYGHDDDDDQAAPYEYNAYDDHDARYRDFAGTLDQFLALDRASDARA